MQGQTLVDIDDTKIGELLNSSGLTVLLVTSAWDGHGVIMRALLGSLSGRYQKVSFVAATVEDSPTICKIFNVTNPPGLLFVKDGELIDQVQGAVGGSTIIDLIEYNS
jgi:thioredoxin-like negative regulator of GroEL